jgi:phosphate starvation-inducible PhoH-like protein
LTKSSHAIRAPHAAKERGRDTETVLSFDDNRLLAELFGEHDRNLALIEKRTGVTMSSRGNRVVLKGPADQARVAKAVLVDLHARLKRGLDVGNGEIEAAIRMNRDFTAPAETPGTGLEVATAKRRVTPRSPRQAEYIDKIRKYELIFGVGPAGTGKTYLAVASAASMLLAGRVDRIILSRPAVEAGERLGFLPGDIAEKIDPYLRPLYDALYDMMPGDQVLKRLQEGQIEVAPLAFMRGRTLANSFVILDEAQNTTPMQMKMFLTRMGENSRMVVNGDPSQVDLPLGQKSGLVDALETLRDVEEIGFVHFTGEDVVRHHMVTKVVEAYGRNDRRLDLRPPGGD